jgi:5-methylcytosine-specific restriction endonuclease McrA
MNKNELQFHVDNELSIREIAEIFECSYTTVRYYLNKYDLKTKYSEALKSWNIDEVKYLSSICASKRELLLKLGKRDASGNYRTLERLAIKHNIDLPELRTAKRTNYKGYYKIPDAEFFVKDSDRKGYALKERLLKSGTLEKCVLCGLGNMWQGKSITLQIDHIDGNHKNNVRLNLRLLCPNCHSQQSTTNRKKTK